MIIIERPYVSEYLVDTIVQHDYSVLYNDVIQAVNIEEDAFRLWDSEKAKTNYQKQEYPLIYSNSENGIAWVLENLPKSNLASYIRLFKDKAAFRETIKQLYPNFYFKLIEYKDINNINKNELKFPLVLKPSVGFLSYGVNIIKDSKDWDSAISNLKKNIESTKSVYPAEVVDTTKFIVEELVEGEEYAIDAYYDRNGDPVILNIFNHRFKDRDDVSDRMYVTSASIMINYMAKFAQFLRNINKLVNMRNFPLHAEVRVTPDGDIIPIEVNPMRFAGWCTTDVAQYAWGINVYECFIAQIIPDWNSILAKAGKEIYYFSMAQVPSDLSKDKIHDFDYRTFLSNYSKVLEFRGINFKQEPLFAVIFGSTEDEKEINRILSLDLHRYIK